MEKGKKIKKSFLAFALCLFSAGVGVFPALFQNPLNVSADAVIMNYDETNIESDLSDMDAYNLYPANQKGKPELIRFQEYCYSEQPFFSNAYGLYLYVYNPAEADVSAKRCYANMAVEYDENGEPKEYENVKLTLVDYTSDWRFLKFKVDDSSGFFKRAKSYAVAHDGTRRYDVAGITLYTSSDYDGKDTKVSKTYKWTGYAQGVNDNKESTLGCETIDLLTINYDVHHTYYREKTSQNVTETDTIHSVYFSVPNDIINAYGDLYRVKAEYLSAKIKPALVVGDEAIYNALGRWTWRNLSSHNEDLDIQIAANLQKEDMVGINHSAEFVLNYESSSTNFVIDYENLNYIVEKNPTRMDKLYLLFPTDTLTTDSADNYSVPAEEIAKQMRATENIITSAGGIEVITGAGLKQRYNKEIFEWVDAEKKQINLTADDTFNLTQTVVQKDFWESLFNMAGSSEKIQEIFTNQPVIYEVKDTDLLVGDDIASQRLFVAKEDMPHLREAFQKAQEEKETLYLFRYRVSKYEYYEATVFTETNGMWEDTPLEWWQSYSTNAYFFSEEVDLAFDIIQTNFRKDGKETVIGVVADPVDYTPSSSPPSNPDSDKGWFGGSGGSFLNGANCNGCNTNIPWWGWILVAVGVIALGIVIKYLSFIGKLFKWIFTILWYLIAWPYYLVRWIARGIRGDDE